jgi:outer membrane receptor protein involved in Fe transport
MLLFTTAYSVESLGTIRGTVIDSKTGQSLGYASVVVKVKGSQKKSPIGATTDPDGNFVLHNVKPGDYLLDVSFMGYLPYEKEIAISSSSKIIDLSKIELSENALQMKDVKVTGMKTQMQFDIDKKVFNVDKSISSTGGSASDVLKNIPSVEVDNEGEVSLRGSTAVTIWVNGKASGLSAENRAQILQQLPAESIEKIEVITNPSAKFSPEGTAGIINIVLKEDRAAGYYGSAQVGGDSRGGYNGSANLNMNSGKLDAYASLGFRRHERRNGGYSKRTSYSGSDTSFLNQDYSGSGNGRFFFSRAGLTYRATHEDEFNLGGMAMFGKGNNNTNRDYQSDAINFYTQSHRAESSDDKMLGFNLELGYKHKFDQNSNIDFTASYNRWGMDGTTLFGQTSQYAAGYMTSSFQKQTRNFKPHTWEFQLDYVNKFDENNKVEAGYKGTLGRENSPVETYYGANESAAIPQMGLFNTFIYNQDIHAAYATYSGRLGKFSYQAGLRGEYSDVNTKSLGYNQKEEDVDFYNNNYFSLFPSAFVSYSLPDGNEIQLNYTRRISRPWGGQLNSFVNITDSTNISFGNPFLKPQYSNSFELNYIKNWQNHMFSFSGYYRTTDDVIQSISYLDNNVMKSTSENITSSLSSGTELVLKDKLFSMLDLTTTVNLYYYKLDGFTYWPKGSMKPVTGKGSDDFSWNAKMMADFSLPEAISLQLTGSYSAKQVVAQGYNKANYTVDAGIRKSFDDLSFSFNVRDLFDSRKQHSVTNGSGYSQESEGWWGGRQFGLTITYSFGNMTPRMEPPKKQGDNNSGYNSEGGY